MNAPTVAVKTPVWETIKLGDVCQKVATVDPRRTPDDNFTYIDVSGVSNQTFGIEKTTSLLGSKAPSRARRLVRAGDVIFATVRPTLMRIAQVPRSLDGAICSTGYIVLRPKPDLDARFLYYSLFHPSFLNAMECLQSGASYPAVNDGQVRSQTITLPPLEQQKRIVAILDQAFAALDRGRAYAEANLADAQKLFESQLDATLSREDNGWSVLPLKSLGSLQTGSTPKTSDPGNFGDDVPFITPAAFRPDGSLDIVNRGLSKQGAAKARMIPRGSALMVCIGATIGKAGFATTDVVANQQINSISPNDDVSGEFLYYQFITPYFQKELMRRAGQATLPIVSKGKWSEIAVRVPSDLSMQLEVAANMHEMRTYTERLRAKYRTTLTDIADLRQSLLQKAFAGDLT